MNGWITDRPPLLDEGFAEANHCVEVTYENGLMGWEQTHLLRE